MAKLNDKMTMLDVIKFLKGISDEGMRDDIRKSLYNMADADDLADDTIEEWVKAYPEELHEGLRGFLAPAVETVKTRVEGVAPEDVVSKDDKLIEKQLKANESTLQDDMSDEDIDAEINAILAELGADEEPPATESAEPEKETKSEEPADKEPAEPEKETKSEEPADKEPAAEEQDETTRNILAGLSNK